MCEECLKLKNQIDAECAEHAKEVADLGARLDQARVWLQDIAAADWGDWCRPAYGLQDMAKEALAAIWKEE